MYLYKEENTAVYIIIICGGIMMVDLPFVVGV